MAFFDQLGVLAVTPGMAVMWAIGLTLVHLAIARRYEPLLLLPIGFGVLAANLPLTGLTTPGEGLFWRFYHYGVEWEVIPPLVFLGLGAHTDFGPLLSQPRLVFLGAAAQGGVYAAFFAAHAFGFTLEEAAAIGIIGGADGPTTIFLAARLAPELLGACAVAAYSYMALVPIIQPPIMRLLTTERERAIRMRKARRVTAREKLVFPLAAAMGIVLLAPASAPLVVMFMLGNLFRESRVVERLTDTAQNALLNVATIFLGVGVGAAMDAATFLQADVLLIFALGLAAFAFGTASGVLLAKAMNLFTDDKINPLVGAAGVSAVPMAARVAHRVGAEADRKNYLLMFAMGPNLAGVIGTVIAAGIFLAMLGRSAP